jgi:transposase-like protein
MKKENEEILQVLRDDRRSHLPGNLREQLIKEVEAGTPRSVIAYQYGVSRAAISKWMKNHGSESYQLKQRNVQLTEVEKRSIVRQIEQGVLTPHAARRAYFLSGNMLNSWLKASLKENVELAAYDPFKMKDKPSLQPELQDTEKDALKKALEEAQLKISALNTLIDVAEDQFKIKIRKKAGARQSR